MEFQNKPLSSEEKKLTELIAVIKEFLERPNANRSQEDSLYYDNADLKRVMNLSDSSLYRMRKKGVLPFLKFLGKIYYRKSFFTKTFRP